jgi:NADPH-dependent ferric siderophore reductase
MTIVAIGHPHPSVTRVTARLAGVTDPIWQRPNIAVRLELDHPPDGTPLSRVYTIRRFDPSDSTLEIDFVRHDHQSPAMRWLDTVRPGNIVQALGPKGHFLPDLNLPHPVAIFADETAVAAVDSILRHWRTGIAGQVFIETPDAAVIDELPKVDGLTFHHLMRDAPTGTEDPSRLPAAARSLADGSRYTVWAAGERAAMHALRGYFQADCGLPRDRVRVFGYWRAGLSSCELDRLRRQEADRHRHTAGPGILSDDLERLA